MQLYIRRIFLVFSCVAFAIIAPLIIFYAMGYRGKPVGVAIIEATPPKATVEVNGQVYGTLPRSIPNLLPGLATIRVTKKGYIPWEKKMEIQPTAATSVRSIRLFPSQFDRDVIVQDSKVFATSPTSSLIASVNTANNLILINDTTSTVTQPIKLSSSPVAITWSPDGTYILVELPNKYYEIFHMEENTLKKLGSAPLTGSNSVLWDPTTVGKLFFLTPKYSLVSYTPSTETSQVVLNTINAYAIQEKTLVYQTLDNTLMTQRIGKIQPSRFLSDTKSGIQNIIPSPNGSLALLFADGELQLSSTQAGMRHIAFGVREALWSPDGQTLLIQTSSGELNTYVLEGTLSVNATPGELQLIVRLSHPITHLRWIPDSEYILYQSGGTIIASEIDTRDHAITTTIQESAPANPFTIVEKDGKSILSLIKNGSKQSLVRTWLVTQGDK